MRLLVLGGTVFLGRAVAAEALRRGHEVVCAARGESGAVPDGAKLVRVDRDAEAGLAPLEGEQFDAVVDVARLSHPWVTRALEALGARARHWTFVSTVSAYADHATPGQTPATGRVREPLEEHATDEQLRAEGGPELYGAIKVASENAVRAAVGDRAFVVRPGLITGPGDGSDRFGYWPARLARGGRVLVPAADRPVQHLDVRDLAGWITTAAETGLTGTFDGVGPVQGLPTLLREIAAASGGRAELVPAPDDRLTAAGVTPWSGPRSLPLWLPEDLQGMTAHDPAPSLAAGLRIRPLAETVAAALETEQELGADRERRAGLSPADEAEVLAGL
ncbi:NAD-dependent epimerase/dehydratase family protein [Amycolatopsis sp. PS_44_ISF1]|uniref:NAD-dependent epimerase/dehydratase family protein n=1 Tax=Amycolatopsis sp. PS_44_ISF1 TaxID=2974917 RepID=UPI0028E02566|nr:NAD-dependent epimerase/dehydratase family protein [Amycolatopsis sp. PS_44_ISF1]MDT8913399.1 NAD-dependent epimerase/dehydratase family protein [Amycolatopsis sp. PS_44_ISF1]